MARSFAVNTSDSIQSLLTSSSTLRTRGMWFRLNEANGATAQYGRIYSKGVGTVDEQVRYLDDVATMEFRFNWTTTGIWQWVSPALNGWHRLDIIYDSSLATNDPSVFIDGSAVGLTKTGTPTGSTGPTAGPFLIGNNIASPSNSGAGAELAEFSIWDRAISLDEINALAKGFTPDNFPQSLVEYVPMVRDNISNVLGAPTLTGTTLFDHPRVITKPNFRSVFSVKPPSLNSIALPQFL